MSHYTLKHPNDYQRKNMEKKVMSGGLQHLQRSHQDPTVSVSSHRRQQRKHPNGKHSCFKRVD